MKTQKKAKFVLIPCVFAAVLFITGCSSMVKDAVAKLHNETIDMNLVKDGTWNGSTETKLVSADVEVTVRDSIIEQVELLRHDCGLGHKADVIVDDIKAQNTWDVDVVSGATLSSEVIKNAVNKALRSAMN